jgi:hypothetical protein
VDTKLRIIYCIYTNTKMSEYENLYFAGSLMYNKMTPEDSHIFRFGAAHDKFDDVCHRTKLMILEECMPKGIPCRLK